MPTQFITVLMLLPAQAATASTHSLEELVKGLAAFEANFIKHESWLVEYEHDRKMHHPPPGFSKTFPLRVIVNARKGPLLYVQMTMSEQVARNGEVDREWYVWKDNECVRRVNDALEIHPRANALRKPAG